MLLIIIEIG